MVQYDLAAEIQIMFSSYISLQFFQNEIQVEWRNVSNLNPIKELRPDGISNRVYKQWLEFF